MQVVLLPKMLQVKLPSTSSTSILPFGPGAVVVALVGHPFVDDAVVEAVQLPLVVLRLLWQSVNVCFVILPVGGVLPVRVSSTSDHPHVTLTKPDVSFTRFGVSDFAMIVSPAVSSLSGAVPPQAVPVPVFEQILSTAKAELGPTKADRASAAIAASPRAVISFFIMSPCSSGKM